MYYVNEWGFDFCIVCLFICKPPDFREGGISNTIIQFVIELMHFIMDVIISWSTKDSQTTAPCTTWSATIAIFTSQRSYIGGGENWCPQRESICTMANFIVQPGSSPQGRFLKALCSRWCRFCEQCEQSESV